MVGFGWMYEEGGGVGVGQGSGDFFVDVVGFVYVDDDDLVFVGQQQFVGFDEIVVNLCQQVVYCVVFEVDGVLGGMDEIEVLVYV